MRKFRLLILVGVVCLMMGCSAISGLMADLGVMTPEEYSETRAIVTPLTSKIPIPFPYSEGATMLVTWVVFLARNKYKAWMRKKANASV